jgi:hypothetical protein
MLYPRRSTMLLRLNCSSSFRCYWDGVPRARTRLESQQVYSETGRDYDCDNLSNQAASRAGSSEYNEL